MLTDVSSLSRHFTLSIDFFHVSSAIFTYYFTSLNRTRPIKELFWTQIFLFWVLVASDYSVMAAAFFVFISFQGFAHQLYFGRVWSLLSQLLPSSLSLQSAQRVPNYMEGLCCQFYPSLPVLHPTSTCIFRMSTVLCTGLTCFWQLRLVEYLHQAASFSPFEVAGVRLFPLP